MSLEVSVYRLSINPYLPQEGAPPPPGPRKDKDLKKQHQTAPIEPQEQMPVRFAVDQPTDDEPLHKFLLRELQKHGVSSRIARELCRHHEHALIAEVLKTAPQRPGVKNLAAYIVSEIKDGGYNSAPTSTKTSSPRNVSRGLGQILTLI
ncbi:MAG: hypothetical protein WC314_16470 [Vulcanimicrobiota bacterium]